MKMTERDKFNQWWINAHVSESYAETAWAAWQAALAATTPVQRARKPIAWLHTLDNTEGIKSNRPAVILSFSEANPFGEPGIDYSETYPVTSKPLYE